MSKKWGLKGNLGSEKLGEEKMLLEIERKQDASRVLARGSRIFCWFNLDFDWWTPSEGCILDERLGESCG